MTDAVFDAWYLPGVDTGSTLTMEVGELVCHYPAPTEELVTQVELGLLKAGAMLRSRPVSELVEVVDAAAARLADPDDGLRQEAEARLAAATGYSPAMTRLVLDHMSADWRTGPLQRLLSAELVDPWLLDGFRSSGPGRMSRAYGPRLALHVFAGNVPGVAVTSLVRALLVKAPSLGKLASGQPVLPVLFARAVESVDADVARALAVTYWPGGAGEAERQALQAADTVVVYGGEAVIDAYVERARPGQRIVDHGPRLSVGLVTWDAAVQALDRTAHEAAQAVAAFDQHGCVSPHALWVEEANGASALSVAEALAGALDKLEDSLPRGRVSPREASAIQQERAAAELRGHAAEGQGTRVFAGAGTDWTVVYDPDPAFRPSCLNRFVRVHPVPALDDVLHLLAPHAPLLQSVAVAGADDRREALAGRLARVGATRVTTFRRLPWPPPEWHHDGRQPLGELLRWVDTEADGTELHGG